MEETEIGSVEETETTAPESAAEEAPEQQEVETTEAPEGEAEQPRKPTAKDRIDELTRLRREAERDAQYWREQALKAPQQQQPEEQPQGDGRPDPNQFPAGEFDPGYVEALTDWKAEQAVTRALHQRDGQNQHKSQLETWNQRVAAAAEKLPDFEEKVILGAQRNEWACTAEMRDALLSADHGAEVSYHLATNPAESHRIARLPVPLQLMELGKLEAKLTAEPKPQPKTVTSAPQPAPQVRGGNGQFKIAPDTDDFASFEKQY